ncbi:hypothetical protein SEVIR_5G177550v4 [Setaria viridis]
MGVSDGDDDLGGRIQPGTAVPPFSTRCAAGASPGVDLCVPSTSTYTNGAPGFLSAHLRWRTRRVQRDGLWPPAAKAASMQVAPVDDESCSSSPPSMVHSLRTRNNSAAPPPV